MADERYKILEPVGTNKICQDLQGHFSSSLSWLDTAYGEAFRNARGEDRNVDYYPAMFKDMSTGQYLELTPDIKRDGNTVFFYVENSKVYNPLGQIASLNSLEISAIFFADLRKVRPTATHRPTAEMEQDAISAILSAQFGGWSLDTTAEIEVFHNFEDVYTAFSYREMQKAVVNMSEYAVMRISFSVTTNGTC